MYERRCMRDKCMPTRLIDGVYIKQMFTAFVGI